MKWLLKNYMKKDKFIYCFSILLNISGGLLANIWPVAAAGKIVDVGIMQNNRPEMIKLFVLSIILFIIGRIMAYFSIIGIDSRTYKMNTRLGIDMHKKLFYMDHDYFENTTVGEMNTLLTKDIKNINKFVAYVIKQFTNEILLAIISLVYCATINIPMALTWVAFMPLYLFVVFNYKKRTDKLYEIEREKASTLDLYIQENIEGNRLIRNLATEDKEIKEFKDLNEDYIDNRMKISYGMFNNIVAMKSFGYLSWFTIILLGGIFIIQGKITVGGFMVFNGFIDRIGTPMYKLVDYMNDFQYFKISINKIKNFMQLKTKQKDNGNLELEDINEIKFEKVNFEIEDKKVLSNINIDMKKNKTYAFIGEVGSGKSSIGRLLLRIIDRTNGTIYIENKKIDEYKISSIRDKIAYVSQTPFLFSDTIKNNVNFGNLDLKDDEIKYYLKLAKADYVEKLEDGIETIIGENGISLSGGEKQRLSLARALARKPQLLILDDITSALDYESELEVTNNINNLEYDCTKIIIAQKIISVKNADRIFVMKSGKIIGEGTHEELLENCDMYKEIYDIQSGKLTNLEFA